MKSLIVLISLIAFAMNVFAAPPAYMQGGVMQQDGNGNATAVQEFTPNGKYDILLTVTKTTVYDMRNFIKWSAYTPACKFRNLSTTTKVGAWRTIPANTYIIRGVHQQTPYLNFSGCTAGEIQRQ